MSVKIFALLTWVAVGVIAYYVYVDIRNPQTYVPNPILSKPKSILTGPEQESEPKKFLPYSELTKTAPQLNESTELALPVLNATGGYMINLDAPGQPDPSPIMGQADSGSDQAEFFTGGEPQYLQSRQASIPVPPPFLKYSKPQRTVTNSAAFAQVKQLKPRERMIGNVMFNDNDAVFAAAQ
jgi:hypothetical protein